MIGARAAFGLRLTGLALLAAAVGIARHLPGHAVARATLAELAIVALGFLAASVGLALIALGAELFHPLPPPIPGCRCRACNQLRLDVDP